MTLGKVPNVGLLLANVNRRAVIFPFNDAVHSQKMKNNEYFIAKVVVTGVSTCRRGRMRVLESFE